MCDEMYCVGTAVSTMTSVVMLAKPCGHEHAPVNEFLKRQPCEPGPLSSNWNEPPKPSRGPLFDEQVMTYAPTIEN